MKEFKGTKGEWKVTRPKGSNGFYCVHVGTGAFSITTATCHNPNGESFKEDDEIEVISNAKLIAAAPELLKACIHLREMLENNIGIRSEIVEAAIKKAMD